MMAIAARSMRSPFSCSIYILSTFIYNTPLVANSPFSGFFFSYFPIWSENSPILKCNQGKLDTWSAFWSWAASTTSRWSNLLTVADTTHDAFILGLNTQLSARDPPPKASANAVSRLSITALPDHLILELWGSSQEFTMGCTFNGRLDL